MQEAVLLPFVLILIMLCQWGVTEADKDKRLCFRAQSIDTGTLVSFILRENGTHAKSLVLYLSIWNEDRQVVYCKTNENDVVIERYLSLCSRRQNSEVVELSANSFNLSVMIGRGSRCDGHEKNDSQGAQLIQIRRQTAGTRRRTKRAIIFPGTLWCGTGSKAFEYHQLGMFEQTDICCREHDHCSSVIRAFSVNFGVFNHNFFTISHCDCDRRFRRCLMEVNDAISHMVGFSFFNFLQVPCFEFTQRKHCSMFNWWGRCTEIQMAPYAILQTQAQYNATSWTKEAAPAAAHQVTVKPSVKHHSTSREKRPVDCGKPEPVKGELVQPKAKKRRKSQCLKAKNTTQSQLTAQSVTPALQNASFPTKVTTFSTVEDVNNTERSESFYFNPQTTTQPSTMPGKNSTWSQMIPTEKSRIISSAQTTGVSTRHSFLNQATPSVPQPSNQPRESQHQQQGCGPRGFPRGDTFLPSHPEEEACSEPESSPAADTGKDSQHLKGTIQIPVAQMSSLDKASMSLNEVAALKKNKVTATVPSNDSTAKTTKSPQERPKSLLLVPTASAVVTSTYREITTVSQSPAITSPNQTRITISTLSKIISSSKQRTRKRPSTHKPENSPKGVTVKTAPQKEKNSASTASKMSSQSGKRLCTHLKDLDDCAHKIYPFERRYGYYNNESKNMYHCDCTHRLSGHLRNLKDAKTIQTLIQDHVSLLCFGLQSTKYCSKNTRCSAVVFPATGLLVALRKMDHSGTLIKQYRPKRYKRRTPVLLYKSCLKIMQSKLK